MTSAFYSQLDIDRKTILSLIDQGSLEGAKQLLADIERRIHTQFSSLPSTNKHRCHALLCDLQSKLAAFHSHSPLIPPFKLGVKAAKPSISVDSSTPSLAGENLVIRDIVDDTIVRAGTWTNLVVSNVDSSRVLILGHLGSLKLTNITNTVLVFPGKMAAQILPLAADHFRDLPESPSPGSSNGSCHVKTLTGCTLYLDAHQLRIHDTRDTKFVVHTQTPPLLEHCTNVDLDFLGCSSETLNIDKFR